MRDALQQMFSRTVDIVGAFLPSLLGAVAILVVGWIGALVARSLVRAALHRTTFDNRIAQWVGGGRPVSVERHAGTVVFWIVMLFVSIAVLQTLHLPAVATPMNMMLGELAAFAPRVAAAALLLLVAWAVARVLRTVVSGALRAARVDERLRTTPPEGASPSDSGGAVSISGSLGEAVYWLVFLLFLPAVLGTLALEGLLGPVQSLVDRLLGFLPHLLGAALILAAGWFIANLVRRIVTNLLAAIGTDRLGERLGLQQAVGTMTLSALTGYVLYVLILLPVIIAALDALALGAVTAPASAMLGSILQAVPALFGAGVLVAIAWFVGRVVAHLISGLLAAAGFDTLVAKMGVATKPAQGYRPSDIVGTSLLVVLMLLATIEAARMIQFVVLADLLARFLVLAGHVALGLVIFGIGLLLSGLAERAVRASSARQANLLAMATRASIIVLAGAMALRQMGLANEIVNLAFGLVVGAIAVAAAIAFGLGARDTAGRVVDDWARQLKG
jgi:hypothetical protein